MIAAARATLRALPHSLSVNLCVISPGKMKKLNHEYRNKNRATDVLSFTSIFDGGDVLVCLAVARRQAKENGILLGEELSRLTVHGILHLFGYDHEKSAAEAKKMFALQEKILGTHFLLGEEAPLP